MVHINIGPSFSQHAVTELFSIFRPSFCFSNIYLNMCLWTQGQSCITQAQSHHQTKLKTKIQVSWLKSEALQRPYQSYTIVRMSVSVLTERRRRFLPLVSVCVSGRSRSRERITGEELVEGKWGETAHGWWAGCWRECCGGHAPVHCRMTVFGHVSHQEMALLSQAGSCMIDIMM